MKVKGKRVAITGAASGIGKALAVAFHSANAASVIASDINKAGVQAVAAEIKSEGIVTDVTNEEDIIRLIKESNDNCGGIDIFCSNVGIGAYEDFLKITNTEWRKMLDTNLMSHIYVVRHVLPQMLDRGSGYLIFTSSAAGLLSQLGSVTYSVTKHAVVSLAEWLKITYGKMGIGVSCVCPQAVRTAMTAQGAGVAGIDGMIEPEVVADDVLEAVENEQFLVTPHKEVLEYIKYKASDYEGWIDGMQNLQEKFIDEINAVIK